MDELVNELLDEEGVISVEHRKKVYWSKEAMAKLASAQTKGLNEVGLEEQEKLEKSEAAKSTKVNAMSDSGIEGPSMIDSEEPEEDIDPNAPDKQQEYYIVQHFGLNFNNDKVGTGNIQYQLGCYMSITMDAGYQPPFNKYTQVTDGKDCIRMLAYLAGGSVPLVPIEFPAAGIYQTPSGMLKDIAKVELEYGPSDYSSFTFTIYCTDRTSYSVTLTSDMDMSFVRVIGYTPALALNFFS